LSGWSHYPTITKAKEEAARLNGVIVRGRKIQVEFRSPDKRQKDNFAIKITNLSLETTKDEIGQLCDGHTLTTGFDIPTHRGTSLESIKSEFRSFGEPVFDRIPDSESDEGPNLLAFVTFPCEAIAQEAITKLSSRKLDYTGNHCLEIEPVYFARYCMSRRIFDVVQQEIERIKDDGTTDYTIQYDEIFGNYRIRLMASSSKYLEFVDANAKLFALLQGETARTDDGNIIWDDYFETPTSAKALQHFLKSHANSIIPDQRTRQIRLFGSKTEQKRAREPLLKLLSKVLAQRHEVIVPRGCMHNLIEQFETIQKEMGINKVTFDVLRSKIVVRGTNEERSEVQNRVDSLNSPTVYKSGCCEICHHQPDDAKILLCLHVYCTPCLRMALRSASYGPLRCIAVTNSPSNDIPGQRCLGHIPYIDDILPPTERDRLLLSSFLAHVRDNPELFVCPSIDCKAIYRSGRQGLNLHCSRCQTEICSFCQTLAHIGMSCSDMKRCISS
jgi:RNA recognition motif-containing protein